MTFLTYIQESCAVIQETGILCGETVERAIQTLIRAVGEDKAILVCGNGGSASDSAHLAGEFVGRFLRERRPIKCINLAADSAILTAWSNDYNFSDVFARQVDAFGDAGGCLIGLTTSGNSENVIAAVMRAQQKKMKTIVFTGMSGGKISEIADIVLKIPSSSTPLIQQAHLAVYHYICMRVEEALL
jgi:D-sedoheptulose 7-phosphate isomerase